MPYDIERLNQFPSTPGVYLMKNGQGEVLYVGKAKNLKQRVKQYFLPGRDGRFMIPYLIAKVEDIEIILVSSEKEALLLENNLIKKYKPRYNALLKDDKTYVALKISNKKTWPKVDLIRYRGKPKADGLYFGPYTSAYAARNTLDLLQRLFPLRQCSDQELIRRTRPCILYDMKRCVAPCVGRCTKQEYDAHVEHTIKFLRGQNKEILQDLYQQMEAASDALEFEKAAQLLRQIREIERTVEVQRVDKPLGVDSDVYGIFRQAEEVIISQMIFIEGRLTSVKHFNFSKIAQDDAELLESFLLQVYEDKDRVPKEILLPLALEQPKAVEDILSQERSYRVDILVPKKGEKKALIDMAHLNAQSAFKQEKDEQEIRGKILLEMQEQFRLSRYPERIECFDNSNTGGKDLVSALVAFTDGEKDPKRYRHYRLKSVDKSDDYASMYEVLKRRYSKGKEDNDLPDLLIVDGGKGQLNIAKKVLSELDIITVDLIGLAKEEGRHDKGMTSEQVFLLDTKDPIFLRKNSAVLFLLQRIRDEAHRFAITYHRKLRQKSLIKSSLDDIAGIGPIKKKELLRHFGSVKRIREADEAQLTEVKSLSSQNIKDLLKFFKQS